MSNVNKSAERGERSCTTPQRMKLIESIKKSIHRSLQKINPADYKNILKGQNIYIHLCYKGQIINSQYTKVALFLGSVVLKKASEKVTVVITNQSSNKIVKKLAAMGKPVLSVLWLEACFQQKRKVPYQDFYFQQQANNHQNEEEKQEQVSVNFDNLTNMYKSKFTLVAQQFSRTHDTNFLRFVDKKQKIDIPKNRIIENHQIDIGKYLPQNNQRRKSQTITDKNIKKRVNKKVQFKSEGSLKQPIENKSIKNELKKTQSDQLQYNENNKKLNRIQQNIQQSKQNKQHNSKLKLSLCEKYLKDFNKYQKQMKQIQQPNTHSVINLEQLETPCFFGIGQQNKMHNSYQQKQYKIQTPPRPIYQENDQILNTYSIKKASNKIRFNIINPMIAQRVSKINELRQLQDCSLIQMAGNDHKNLIWIVSSSGLTDTFQALISKPKTIVSESLISALQKQPLLQINESLLKKHQVKCRLNNNYIEGKKILLINTLFPKQLLSKIIKQCKGQIISMNDYLFKKADFIITNRKDVTKSFKQEGKYLIEATFIENLIQFYD